MVNLFTNINIFTEITKEYLTVLVYNSHENNIFSESLLKDVLYQGLPIYVYLLFYWQV